MEWKRDLALFAALASSIAAQADESAWTYRMNGQLDGDNASCRGRARVRSLDRDGRSCVEWELLDQRCTGASKSVDWVHDHENRGEVCRAGDWELVTRLPGLGRCDVEVSPPDGPPAELRLACIWRCRERSHPCEGAAEYVFARATRRSERQVLDCSTPERAFAVLVEAMRSGEPEALDRIATPSGLRSLVYERGRKTPDDLRRMAAAWTQSPVRWSRKAETATASVGVPIKAALLVFEQRDGCWRLVGFGPGK
jgi:hypothetical protein